MHLDAITRKPPSSGSASTQQAKPTLPAGGTEQGLYAASLSTQRDSTEASDGTSLATSGSARKPGDDDRPTPARITIKTLKDAQEVCAKRRANLELKKQDKCPLCARQHTFEKVWSQTTPTIKTPMVSTQLASCPTFAALSSDQKMMKVTAHAACPVCTSWEHNRHRLPGGKEAGEPKCKVNVAGSECGGRHGKWFHQAAQTQGTTGNLVTDPLDISDQNLPGLYEVYRAEFLGPPEQQKFGTIMVDNGSDTNYVRHEFARSLGLTGEPLKCRIKVVDTDFRLVETARYSLTVLDALGTPHVVHALGLETITSLPPDPDLSPLQSLMEGVHSRGARSPTRAS